MFAVTFGNLTLQASEHFAFLSKDDDYECPNKGEKWTPVDFLIGSSDIRWNLILKSKIVNLQ